MSRKPARMLGLAIATLLAASPAAAYADQWTAQRVHSTVMNTDRNAHAQSERHGGNVGAAAAGMLQRDGRRTRVEHTALNRQANELSNRTMR